MNKARRKELERAKALIDEAAEIIAAAKDEEQDYFDNMPESLQGGDKGAAAEQAVDALDEAASDLEGISSKLDDVIFA